MVEHSGAHAKPASPRTLERSLRENFRLLEDAAHAQAASEMQSRFLMNVSHELRTPLNAIIGFSEMMRDELIGPLGTPAYRGYANDIFSAGQRLLATVGDILEMARLDAGETASEAGGSDTRKVIDEVLRRVQAEAQAKGVELAANTEAILPPLRSDARRLRVALHNLVSNAVRYTGEGGKVRVSSHFNDDRSGVRIVVSDTGIGIDPERIPKILTPFGGVGDAWVARPGEGIGLGLPLAKRLVESLGGHLALASVQGAGTTVTVNVPFRDAVQAPIGQVA